MTTKKNGKRQKVPLDCGRTTATAEGDPYGMTTKKKGQRQFKKKGQGQLFWTILCNVKEGMVALWRMIFLESKVQRRQ
jgi:hypothetical protein